MELPELFPHPRDLPFDRRRRGAAFHVAPHDAGEKVDRLINIRLERGMGDLVVRKGQAFERTVSVDAQLDQFPGYVVRVAEGNALSGQVIRAVGRVDKSLRGCCTQVFRIEGC